MGGCGVLLMGGKSCSEGGQFPVPWVYVEFCAWVWEGAELGFWKGEANLGNRCFLRGVESCEELCLPPSVCSIVTVVAFLLSERRRLILWVQVLT